jgi:hypothetical protein
LKKCDEQIEIKEIPMKLKLVSAAVLMFGLPGHLFCMDVKVKLVSSDGKEFELLKAEAEESETLKNLLAEHAKGDIPLSQVSSQSLSLLVDDMKRRHMRKAEGETAAWREKNQEFQKSLNKLSLTQLIALYKAADYLDMYHLYEAIAERVAAQVPPRIVYVIGELGMSLPDYTKAALEILKAKGLRYYGAHGLRQNFREAALFALDKERSSQNNINEPTDADIEALHKIWLSKEDIAALPHNLRFEMWFRLHQQYTGIRDAIETEEAIHE